MVRRLADRSSSESLVRYTFHPVPIVKVLKGLSKPSRDFAGAEILCCVPREFKSSKVPTIRSARSTVTHFNLEQHPSPPL